MISCSGVISLVLFRFIPFHPFLSYFCSVARLCRPLYRLAEVGYQPALLWTLAGFFSVRWKNEEVETERNAMIEKVGGAV